LNFICQCISSFLSHRNFVKEIKKGEKGTFGVNLGEAQLHKYKYEEYTERVKKNNLYTY